MFTWDDKSIKWFSESSKNTSFHKIIASKIIPYLDYNKTLLSLGSGLGFLERELSSYVASMTLVDNSDKAIEYLKKNKEEKQTIIKANWQDIKIQNDYLLLSFFSRMYVEDTLDEFFKLTKRYIFYLVNERRSDFQAVKEYLIDKKAHFKYERMEIEFDQILEENEVSQYLYKYYSNASETKKLKLLKEFKPINENKLVFKNKKKVVLFIISKGEID